MPINLQAQRGTNLGALDSFAQKASPGLLQRVGQILNYPRKKAFETVFGRELSGRELLGLYSNPPGIDFGDVAGFAAEIVTDPLSFVSGIGGASRAGRLAARAGKLENIVLANRLRAGLETGAKKAFFAGRAQEAEVALKGIEQALATSGLPSRLAPTIGAQAQAGQRYLVGFGLPLGPTQVGIRGAPVLDRVGRLGGRLTRAPVLGPTLEFGRRLFDNRIFRSGVGEYLEKDPRLAPFMDIFRGEMAKRAIDARDLRDDLLERMDPLVTVLGGPEKFQEFLQGPFIRGRESLGIPDQILNLETARRTRLVQEVRDFQNEFHKERIGRLAREASRAAASGFGRSAGLSQAARSARDPKLKARIEKLAQLAQVRTQGRIAAIKSKPLGKGERAALDEGTQKLIQEYTDDIIRFGKASGEARAALALLPGGARDLGKYLHDELRGLLEREIDAGARSPGNILSAQTKAYMERVLTPQARTYLLTKGRMEEFELALHRAASTKTASQKMRTEEMIEKFTDEANRWFSQHAPDFKGDWFEWNPAKSFPQRWLSGEMSIEFAKLARGVIDAFGNQVHIPGKTVELAEFIERGPLHNVAGITMPRSKEAINAVLKQMGMDGLGIPKQIAEEVLQMHKKLTGPEEFKVLLEGYDVALGLWRGLVTTPFLQFHTRNLISDSILSWLGGGLDLRKVKEAFRIAVLPQKVNGKWHWGNPAELKQLEGLNIFRGQSAREALRDVGMGAPNLLAQRLAQRFPGVERAIQRFEGTARLVENFTRTWHFLSKKAQGLTDQEAAESVRRWLLDYGELTDFERQVMKRAIFFYNWPRKVLPRLFESYFTRTNRAALVTRATTAPTLEREGPLPEYLRRTAAIPIGRDEAGQRVFLTGTASPLEELEKLGSFGLAFLQQLAPPVRIPLEYITGREFFSGRDIAEADRASALLAAVPGLRDWLGIKRETLPNGAVRFRADPYRLYIMRNLPVSRMFNEYGERLLNILGIVREPSRPQLEDLVRFTTGARFERLEPAEERLARQSALERLAQDLLRSGELRRVHRFFAPGEATPQAEEFLQAQEALDRFGGRRRERAGAFRF